MGLILVLWLLSVQSNLKYKKTSWIQLTWTTISRINTSDRSKPDSTLSIKTMSCSELQLMRQTSGYMIMVQSNKSWLNSDSNGWLIPWSKTDLREIIFHSEQVWEELMLSWQTQVEDILDMSLDILQLRDLRSLRQISTICLRDLEIPQDLHQTTGIGFKWNNPDKKKCLQSKTQTVIF